MGSHVLVRVGDEYSRKRGNQVESSELPFHEVYLLSHAPPIEPMAIRQDSATTSDPIN
jgi:hypothetical protein